ncbi:MAG: hypothetical protein H6621_03270 [Halobacteriovoraceae bacterium]|nr:hypothetical protein [Halobacteriovoraceae bacterium]MCB9094067.1 hypothetical protein [Halobacteriovoraceae bacterium]
MKKIVFALLMLSSSLSFAQYHEFTFECSWYNPTGEGYEHQVVIRVDGNDFMNNGGGIAEVTYKSWVDNVGMVQRLHAVNAYVENTSLERHKYSFDVDMGRSGTLSIESLKKQEEGNATVLANFWELELEPTEDIMCRFFDGSGMLH